LGEYGSVAFHVVVDGLGTWVDAPVVIPVGTDSWVFGAVTAHHDETIDEGSILRGRFFPSQITS